MIARGLLQIKVKISEIPIVGATARGERVAVILCTRLKRSLGACSPTYF